MKALGKKIRGGKKSAESPHDYTPNMAARRRRFEESTLQRMGLAKAEMDENTGDLEDSVQRFKSCVEGLEKLYDQMDRIRKAQCTLDEAYSGLAASYDDDLSRAVASREERYVHDTLVRGWVLDEISATIASSERVIVEIKKRKDAILDYHARKRKMESTETKAAKASSHKLEESLSDRRAKFEHCKEQVRTMTAYVGPLLEAYVEAATECRSDALQVLAASHYSLVEAQALELRQWAAGVYTGDACGAKHVLIEVTKVRDGQGPPRPTAPMNQALKTLTVQLEAAPVLQDFSEIKHHRQAKKHGGSAVYGAPLSSATAPPVRALEALLDYLQTNGLERQGVFRIPGNQDDVEALKAKIDEGEDPSSVLQGADVDDVATLTKMWFRERDQPFLDDHLLSSLRSADDESFIEDVNSALHDFANASLPNHAAAFCLCRLLAFLRVVADNSDVNMMSPENIAICFAPNILLSNPNDPSAMLSMQPAIALMERLVVNAPSINFDGGYAAAAAASTPSTPPPK